MFLIIIGIGLQSCIAVIGGSLKTTPLYAQEMRSFKI
jgi:hypothetical protein